MTPTVVSIFSSLTSIVYGFVKLLVVDLLFSLIAEIEHSTFQVMLDILLLDFQLRAHHVQMMYPKVLLMLRSSKGQY